KRFVVVDLGAILARVLRSADRVLPIGRELEIAGLVKVPVFLRSGERHVRFHETDRKEEGLSGSLCGLEPPNALVGNASVRIRVVGNIDNFPRRALGKLPDAIQLPVREKRL